MASSTTTRIQSIDILRGLVMVIMALDHVRDYFHINAFAGNYPENMDSTNLMLFGTRFITHYCAPVFVFLAGTSAYLYGQKKTKKQLSKFLITRGFWLILVEIVVINFLWWFDSSFGYFNLQVIWAIGVCMIALGVLIYLPFRLLLVLGLAIVLGHNLLDGIIMEGQSPLALLWYFLHQMSFLGFSENHFMSFTYPVLPWIGVIVLGYCFGSLYKRDANDIKRQQLLLYLGITSILLFFLLRTWNIYGDALHWRPYDSTELSIVSYFNVSKYPPSLLFLLITLGPAFLFLRWIEPIKTKVTDVLLVFGRVPFFYYVIHIGVIHIGAMIGLVLTGKDWRLMILDNETMSTGALQGYGYSLFIVYLVWIGIVALLYPICLKYMKYKLANKDKWWLSYL